jgi:hypothetical protein
VLPGAYRVPRAIATCRDRLTQLTSWLNWLTSHDVTSLGQVTQQYCDAFLEHRRYQRDEHGNPVRELSGTARQAAVVAVLDLYAYGWLLAGGGYRPGLRPWDGRSAAAITGTVPRHHNTTPPVTDEVLRPMLAAALHFTEVTGPLVADLAQQVRAAARVPAARPDTSRGSAHAGAVIGRVLDQRRAAGEPLPLTAGHLVKRRLNSGWTQPTRCWASASASSPRGRACPSSTRRGCRRCGRPLKIPWPRSVPLSRGAGTQPASPSPRATGPSRGRCPCTPTRSPTLLRSPAPHAWWSSRQSQGCGKASWPS